MQRLILWFCISSLAAGCCSSKPKASLQRGWIGGEYKCASSSLVPKGVRCDFYVQQVYPDSPVEQAGLKAGDLILAVNGQPTSKLKDFRHRMDTAEPGSKATFQVLRAGQTLELPVTIGRETYQQWHSFVLGFRASTHFDLWPNPDFSLLPVGSYSRPEDRVELSSPQVLLAKRATKTSSNGETGTESHEGWDAWFLLFGFNAHKQILKQEIVWDTVVAPARSVTDK